MSNSASAKEAIANSSIRAPDTSLRWFDRVQELLERGAYQPTYRLADGSDAVFKELEQIGRYDSLTTRAKPSGHLD
jgi:hypothetical protein